MAQIALTFDLFVWDIKPLTLSTEMREELKGNNKDIAEWWPLVAHSTGVCRSVHVSPHQLTMR